MVRFVSLLCAAVALTAPAVSALPAHAAKVEVTFAGPAASKDGTVIVPVIEGSALTGPAAALDAATQGGVTRAMAAANFTGKSGETLQLHGLGGHEGLVLIGLGKGPFDQAALETFGDRALAAAGSRRGPVRILWGDLPAAADAPAAVVAFGAVLGGYDFDKYKADKANAAARQLVVHAANHDAAAHQYLRYWQPVAEGVIFARDLITEPANVIYPETFVERTRAAFRGVDKTTVEALDVDAMKRLGMGALLGVGQGSVRPPRLLVVTYNGGKPGDAPVVFAGKGITFDSGGISIKPAEGMGQMKYDMSGAAVATGTVLALAKRGAKVNAVAIGALAENMPDGGAIRPGDILKTMSGKTFEVINTDAEGRMVLADAVTYAQAKFKPRLLVDVATLTGAARMALGDDYAALFSRQDDIADQVIAAGRRANEEVWRMPLHPSYAEGIRSDVADLKGGATGRGHPGAGIGAQVISTFVLPETPWAHLDIAGVAWLDQGQPTRPRGATAFGIRLLNQLVRDRYEAK